MVVCKYQAVWAKTQGLNSLPFMHVCLPQILNTYNGIVLKELCQYRLEWPMEMSFALFLIIKIVNEGPWLNPHMNSHSYNNESIDKLPMCIFKRTFYYFLFYILNNFDALHTYHDQVPHFSSLSHKRGDATAAREHHNLSGMGVEKLIQNFCAQAWHTL